ncbi:hypothetical protein TUM4445_37710 [Shewanella sp. MBTL60-112-B2]|nr:hypothetical protein TUM4444_38770 [Shewanella sp. MBTL60-112-B1]GIU39875.1 hypothetical protein TUM4445_37710 [Shewanella sp. MBTL60-112-B2]
MACYRRKFLILMFADKPAVRQPYNAFISGLSRINSAKIAADNCQKSQLDAGSQC